MIQPKVKLCAQGAADGSGMHIIIVSNAFSKIREFNFRTSEISAVELPSFVPNILIHNVCD
jgi:hypothetical protein